MDQSTKRIKCAVFMFIVISWIWPVAFQIVYLVISNNEGVISNNEGKRLKWYINGQISTFGFRNKSNYSFSHVYLANNKGSYMYIRL